MRVLFRLLLGFVSAMSLVGVTQVPASAVPAEPTAIDQINCNPCMNGFRFQNVGSKGVYLVIDGERHHVPDETTYYNLWATWGGFRPDGAGIPIGLPLANGAFLAMEVETGKVYLVGRTKRWIPNMTVFDQYAFDVARIHQRLSADLPAPGADLPGR